MQEFRLVSKILRNRLNPEPPPRASTNDHDPDEGIPLDTTQDDEEIATDTKNTTYLSARERLDKLSRFRTNSSAISINLSGGQSCGAYAPVFQATFKRARWSRKQKVAVKKLPFRDMDSPMFANSFVHEAETMAGLSHENIVRFVAFVEDLEHGEAWIIMPWEPNGNINEFLRARKCEIPERISLIKDTFEGIQYLHTRQPPICHGALKSFNILVSSSYRAIITGFGSARVVSESGDGGTNKLGLPKPGFSDRWAAPETLNEDCRGLPSDIWSAGWVCWEIMTEKLPFYELKSEAAVLLRVIQGQVPSPSEYEPLSEIVRLCSLMTDCWAFDPRERPIISRCCNEVKWVPSIPPLGGAPSDSKVAGNRLLLQMGRTHYLHARYVPAASLFQQVLDSANSDKGQKEMSEALYWLGTVSAAQCKYPTAEEYYTQAQSTYALIKDDLGRANTLRGLGDIYHLQSKVSEAEEVFTRAQEIYDGVGDDQGRASALCGLGHIYRLRFNYNRAKVVFSQSHEIYARIGDGQGRANTLQGLGTVYHLESRLTEAEEALSGAKKIYARIGDDVGLAEVLVGLGVLDCDRGRYAETESTFTQALEIHSRIGNQRGQADALCGLGNMYLCQSRYMEATSTFKEAKAIYASIGHPSGEADSLHGLGRAYRGRSNYSQARSSYTGAQKLYTRIENDGGRANVLYGLGELNRIESKYDEATSSYTEAQKIYARIGQDERRADTLCILGEIYRSESKHDEATSSYTEAQKIYTRIGHKVEAAAASEDHGYTWVLQPTDSNAQGTSDETHQIESPENLGLPEASLSSCSPQLPTTLNSTGNSLSLPSHRIKDDPASSQIASAEDSSPKSNRQEQTLFEEVTAIARTSANEELVDLLQALGKTAPKAVRNKHKIYSVLRIARDICNHIIELGNPPERQIDTNLKTLLRQMEDYCLLRDALERALLEFAEILLSEITTFGADLYSSWSRGRSDLARILRRLCHPPFPTMSSKIQDIADDSLFDDCSWLSRLLSSGIRPEVSIQFPDVPKTHPALVVENGLHYLEVQMKCRVLDEPTRELTIEVATLLALSLLATSQEEDHNILEKQASLPAQADRDWLINALSDSFSTLDLDSNLQPLNVQELASKLTDVKTGFTSRGSNALAA